MTLIVLMLQLPPPARSQTHPSFSKDITIVNDVPWRRRAVFYEVFVRSFADSTTGPLAGDGIGDLQGLIEKLDYLNDGDPKTTDDLGITGIWLMPIMQSPNYHGYDIVDYYTVEQDYGANEDFKRLMQECRRRGIRVIIDLVLNHTSRRHPWFVESSQNNTPKRNWYRWLEEKPQWGRWRELNGRWYYGRFGGGMPDLNYRNQAVTEQMWAVTRFWLEEMGADGFRLDAIRHLIEEGPIEDNTEATHQWLRQFYQFYKGINTQALAVGEVWDTTEAAASYVGDQLDLTFQFELAGAILDAVNTGSTRRLISIQAESDRHFLREGYATFLTNHDQNRVMTVLRGDADRAKLAATILLTLPGTPFIYYGEEIGMTGAKPDPKIRTPMQWSAKQYAGFSTSEPWQTINDGYQQVNVEAQNPDPRSLLNWYRKLITLRNTHPALQTGAYRQVDADHLKVFAFMRQEASETFLIVINLGNEIVDEYTLTLATGPLTGAGQVKELLHSVPVAPPKLNQKGGFGNYQPIDKLTLLTGYVIQINFSLFPD